MKLNLVNVLDTLSKQSRLVVVDGKMYVVKDYASEIGLLKWYIVTLSNIAMGIYPFKFEPVERLKREVSFMRRAFKCFHRPELLLVDYGRVKIVREFVKGKVYNYNAPCSVHFELGRGMGSCHESGWVLGDTKISNFVYQGDRVYIVDAEQAINEYNPEYAAWDLLVLASTLFMEGYVKALNTDMSGRVIEFILKGYLEGNGDGINVLKTLRTSDFKALLYLLVPFPLNYLFAKKAEE
ncbi:MAG: serine/threonine protein kinase, partial [Desulfurococcaceae archaeon]